MANSTSASLKLTVQATGENSGTWGQITNTNLLILDEIFDSSLDGQGTDEFLRILNTLDNENVFVISHKGDQLVDKFRNSIKFVKTQNFSRIAS